MLIMSANLPGLVSLIYHILQWETRCVESEVTCFVCVSDSRPECFDVYHWTYMLFLPPSLCLRGWWWRDTSAPWSRKTCGLWTMKTAPRKWSHSWCIAGTTSARRSKGQEHTRAQFMYHAVYAVIFNVKGHRQLSFCYSDVELKRFLK